MPAPDLDLREWAEQGRRLGGIGRTVGWWIGDWVGLMTAVILSAIGSGVGMYLVLKLEREHLT